jgi:hypothetical protein
MLDHQDSAETIRLELVLAETDAEELERVSASLRRQLLELDVRDVRIPAGGAAPDGARSPGLAEVVILLDELGKAGAGLLPLLTFLNGWLSRRRAGSLSVTVDGDTITLDAATPEQQDAAFQLFLQRHGGETAT